MKTELTITTRPLRHVYFIADNDLSQFINVASFCCTQWGGINNLIVPINTAKTMSTDTPSKEQWFHSLLQQHTPDIFINALPENAQACSVWRWFETEIVHSFPGRQVLPWETFCREDQSLHPLQILSSDERLKRFAVAKAVFFNYEKPSDLTWAAKTAVFGTIWPGQEQAYASVYELRNFPLSISQEAMLRQQLSLDPYTSIINLTLKELGNLVTVSLFPSLHFDVVIAQDVEDLCRFWNLRAFAFGHHWLPDRRVLLLTKEQLFDEHYSSPLFRLIEEKRNFPPDLAEMIQERSQRSDIQAKLLRVHLDVVFHHNNDEEISQFLQSQQSLKPGGGRAFRGIIDDQGQAVSEEILPWDENKESRPIFYAENLIDEAPAYREYGGKRSFLSVEIAEGENSLFVPKAGPSTSSNGAVKVGVQSALWEAYLPHASVADLMIPHASFEVLSDNYNLMLAYTSLITPAEMQRISLALPTTWQMYQAYFQARGYTVDPSDKMIYATGLLDRAGGLEKAEILRSRTAYNILDMLAMRATQKLAREITKQIKQEVSTLQGMEDDIMQVIAVSGFLPRFQRNPQTLNDIKSRLETHQKKECVACLTELVKIKAVQRGLTITCPHCGTAIWYGLGELDEQVKCLGCLERFDVPLRETPQSSADRSLQYALNPLADRAMDQDVLPVIIALLTLRTQHQAMAHIVPGMAFKKVETTHIEGDFDFVYVYRHHLYGGECKAGSMLQAKDVQTARLARQLGFRAFFFVTIRTFSAESKQLIYDFQQELKNEPSTDLPFSVLLLEEQELFEGKLLSDLLLS